MNIQTLQTDILAAATRGDFTAVESLVLPLSFKEINELDPAVMCSALGHMLTMRKTGSRNAAIAKAAQCSKFFNIAACMCGNVSRGN